MKYLKQIKHHRVLPLHDGYPWICVYLSFVKEMSERFAKNSICSVIRPDIFAISSQIVSRALFVFLPFCDHNFTDALFGKCFQLLSQNLVSSRAVFSSPKIQMKNVWIYVLVF
jgi:hypothetical protein